MFADNFHSLSEHEHTQEGEDVYYAARLCLLTTLADQIPEARNKATLEEMVWTSILKI